MFKARALKSKERFLRIYANLPLNVREEIIYVTDNRPMTWNVAYLEIKNETKLGLKILKKLEDLEII